MGDTNYGDGYQKSNFCIEVAVFAYSIKKNCKQKFEHFYETEIRRWFAQNYVGQADSWIVGDYLIVVSTIPMRVWSAIPKLDEYLEQLEPVHMQALPKYSPGSSAASYAAD